MRDMRLLLERKSTRQPRHSCFDFSDISEKWAPPSIFCCPIYARSYIRKTLKLCVTLLIPPWNSGGYHRLRRKALIGHMKEYARDWSRISQAASYVGWHPITVVDLSQQWLVLNICNHCYGLSATVMRRVGHEYLMVTVTRCWSRISVTSPWRNHSYSLALVFEFNRLKKNNNLY